MMGLSHRTWFALLVAGLLVPATASAQDVAPDNTEALNSPADDDGDPAAIEALEEADATIEDAAEKDGKDWSISASLGSTIGQGTFVDPANDSEWAGLVDDGDNAYDRVNLSLSLRPAYSFGDYSVSGSFGAVQWLTAGGGANEPGEFRIQDVGLSGGWAGYTIPVIDTQVGAGLSLQLPTSTFSRALNLIVGTSVSGSLSKTFFERLTLSYSLSVGKDFHEREDLTVDAEDVGVENVLFRSGEAVGGGQYAIGGVLTEWALVNGVSANVKIWEKLSGSVSYALIDSWTYDWENDDSFTAPLADTGRGHGQATSTGISLSYPVWEHISLSGGIATSQQPKTDDQKSFRFPFWNFDGAARNASAIRLSVTGTY